MSKLIAGWLPRLVAGRLVLVAVCVFGNVALAATAAAVGAAPPGLTVQFVN
jgi:hypothetical protein